MTESAKAVPIRGDETTPAATMLPQIFEKDIAQLQSRLEEALQAVPERSTPGPVRDLGGTIDYPSTRKMGGVEITRERSPLLEKKDWENLSRDDLVAIISQHRGDLVSRLAPLIEGGGEVTSMACRVAYVKAHEAAALKRIVGEVLSEKGIRGVKKGDLVTLLSQGLLHSPNIGMREKPGGKALFAAMMPGMGSQGYQLNRDRRR